MARKAGLYAKTLKHRDIAPIDINNYLSRDSLSKTSHSYISEFFNFVYL